MRAAGFMVLRTSMIAATDGSESSTNWKKATYDAGSERLAQEA